LDSMTLIICESFIEISEMACVTSAWSSRGQTLKSTFSNYMSFEFFLLTKFKMQCSRRAAYLFPKNKKPSFRIVCFVHYFFLVVQMCLGNIVAMDFKTHYFAFKHP